MENKVTGTLVRFSEVKQVTEKFRTRTIHVLTADQYPQTLEFQLVNDKCDIALTQGSQVEVSYNLRGREWTNQQGEVKVFNTLEAWKVVNTSPAPILTSEPDDDLPF